MTRLTTWVVTFAFALSAAGTASAQNDEHAAANGSTESEQGEHGEHAHHPDPINWTVFGGGSSTQGAPGGEAHESHPLPPPFIATLFNFAILLGLVIWGVRRAVNPALADRRAAIEDELGEAQRLRSEAEAMHREYTERLANMEKEFATMRAEFMEAGQAEYKRIIDEAETRAERLRKDGQFAIEQEVKQLRTDLIREAVDAAISSAETAVRSAIGPQDQTRLADEYLAGLEKSTRGSA